MRTDFYLPSKILPALVACAGISTSYAEAARPLEASMTFAGHGIANWEADGSRGIWVQGLNRQWFYGEFMDPCFGLPFANTVGFVLGPAGQLDKWGSVVVPREGRCVFKSFTVSDAPRGKGAQAETADRRST